MARRYPAEVHAFLREIIPGRTSAEVSRLVNARFDLDMTESMVKSYKQNHHIRSGTPCGRPQGSPSKVFPQEVADYIRENCRGIGPTEMALRLNETFGTQYITKQINAYYKNHHLLSGITGRFEKGHIPANKGKTWAEYMTPEAQERSKASQFKKGQIPHNGGLPIGTVRIRYEHKKRNNKRYAWEKVAQPNVWRMKHVLEWERHNGPVPPGYMVAFANGDTMNWSIDNLVLETRAQHAVKNRWGLRGYDKESAEVCNKLADIKMEIRKRSKQK